MAERAFKERVADVFSGVTVDTTNGFIDGLPLLGLKSKNGHDYDETGTRRAVEAGLFDNVQIYTDHTETDSDGKVRSFRELIGATGKARWDDATKQVRARADIIKSDASGMKMLEMASRPALARAAGISIDGMGEFSDDGKRVMGINRIASADIVTRPATTRGLTESVRPGAPENKETDMAEKKLTEYTVAEILAERADVKDAVLRESKAVEESKSLKEKLDAANAELKTLRESKAVADTQATVAAKIKASKLTGKIAEKVTAKFAGKSATAEEIDGYLADVKELLEAAGRPAVTKVGDLGIGPRDVAAADDGDDGEDVGSLLESAFAAIGAPINTKTKSTLNGVASED